MPTNDDVFGLVGVALDAKYDVESVLARGGFGVVYRASHRALRRPVAIKVLSIPEETAPAAREKIIRAFLSEAQTVARLAHPAVVRVLDFGAFRSATGELTPWMALEWVEGTALSEHLQKRRGRGGRSPAECLALLRPIFEAIEEAHACGIVHRDLKPANLMLTGVGKAGSQTPALRLLDFGIAKVMDEGESPSPGGQTMTRAQLLTYTLAYASPEQITGHRSGPWTDVHALALVLTELLTDASPFTGTDTMGLHRQILALERPTPARWGLQVGPWEPVLARALALNPGDRYARAGEFLAALEAQVPKTSRGCDVEATVPLASFQGAALWTGSSSARSRAPEGTTAAGVREVAAPPDAHGTAKPRLAGAAALALVALAAFGAIVHRQRPESSPHVARQPPLAPPARTVPREATAAPATPPPPVARPTPTASPAPPPPQPRAVAASDAGVRATTVRPSARPTRGRTGPYAFPQPFVSVPVAPRDDF